LLLVLARVEESEVVGCSGTIKWTSSPRARAQVKLADKGLEGNEAPRGL
jgi:hypothetical protein